MLHGSDGAVEKAYCAINAIKFAQQSKPADSGHGAISAVISTDADFDDAMGLRAWLGLPHPQSVLDPASARRTGAGAGAGGHGTHHGGRSVPGAAAAQKSIDADNMNVRGAPSARLESCGMPQ